MDLIATDDTKAVQELNPAHRLLRYKPNQWQTPSEFKALMQLRAMLDGQSFALIVRSMGRPIALVPMPRGYVRPIFDWNTFTLSYEVTNPAAGSKTLGVNDVLHLRDLSLDGWNGISRMRLSREVIELATNAERAAAKTFERGVMAGGAISVEGELSDESYDRLKQQIADNYSGAENAGDWMIIEGGGKAAPFTTTAQAAQLIEIRNHQIEEVARQWGVPRPLLMMSDTSWGSGIQQLAIYFTQYTLSPWFKSWEEAAQRSLIPDAMLGKLRYRFDESELMRGTLAELSDFFSKALGAGGSSPVMTQNEVRAKLDLPKSDDPQADRLRNPMTQKTTDPAPGQPGQQTN
jgi:HK97 family phage portal protein